MRTNLPPALLRAVILAALAIAGATWALVRHATYSPAPMLVPVAPREVPGEIPVPELLDDGASP